MSIVSSCTITNPYGKTDECAQFTIDDLSTAFTFNDIMIVDKDYTFSFWVKSEAEGNVIVGGSSFATSTEWAQYSTTFKAASTDLYMPFGAVGVYYIYHPQLESGTLATDWTPAPEDMASSFTGDNAALKSDIDTAVQQISEAKAQIEMLANAISMLVTDGNGGSLMTQTEDGWTFNISQLTDTLDDATANIETLIEDMGGVENTVSALQQAVTDVGIVTEYVKIITYDGQPCIELGESDSNFKLRITNTQIQFMEGSAIPAYISNQKLNIEKAEIKNELQFGNFVWKVRDNGNMGLMWKGGST